MAVVPVSATHPFLRREQLLRSSSLSSIKSPSSSYSSSLQFSSLSLYPFQLKIQSLPRNHHSIAVACLPSSPPPKNTASSTKLYVSGLSFRTTEEGLRNAFQNFGQLVEVNLVMDKRANRPRGFAFLRYATEEESKNAIEGMHGKFLDGRVIFVEVAKPRSELPQSFNQTPRRY